MYDEKTKLFGTKTAFQFGGYLAQVLVGMALALMFNTDVLTQVYLQTIVYTALLAVAIVVLLRGVKERPPPKAAAVAAPIIPSVRDMFSNRPYMLYLLFRVPMTLAALLPSNLLVDYVKFNMREENWSETYYFAMAIVLLSVFLAIPLLVRLSRRFGKGRVLAFTCAVESLICAVSCAMPPSLMAGGPFYGLCVAFGFGMASCFVLPDAILADTIDYDELLTGRRNEGLYTVMETNLQQYVEIIGGVLPGLCVHYTGFQSNGGCGCGCGTQCGAPYHRWSCPGDIGYACTDAFGARVLYGDARRDAPCTEQNEATQLTYRLFFLGVPALCYLLAVIPASRMAIERQAHEAILTQLKARDSQPGPRRYAYTDPLTGKQGRLAERSARDYVQLSFSARERRAAAARLPAMRRLLDGRPLVWGAGAALPLPGMAAPQLAGEAEAFTTVVTLGCLALAGVFVLVAWDGRRLHLTYHCAPDALADIPGSSEAAEPRDGKNEGGTSEERSSATSEARSEASDLSS